MVAIASVWDDGRQDRSHDDASVAAVGKLRRVRADVHARSECVARRTRTDLEAFVADQLDGCLLGVVVHHGNGVVRVLQLGQRPRQPVEHGQEIEEHEVGRVDLSNRLKQVKDELRSFVRRIRIKCIAVSYDTQRIRQDALRVVQQEARHPE